MCRGEREGHPRDNVVGNADGEQRATVGVVLPNPGVGGRRPGVRERGRGESCGLLTGRAQDRSGMQRPVEAWGAGIGGQWGQEEEDDFFDGWESDDST